MTQRHTRCALVGSGRAALVLSVLSVAAMWAAIALARDASKKRSPSATETLSVSRGPRTSECRSPLEPGCRRCVERFGGDSYHLHTRSEAGPADEYGEPTWVHGTPPPELKPCALCTVGHERALRRRESQQTCQDFESGNGLSGSPDEVSTRGQCDRYHSILDFLPDPGFAPSSCLYYCFDLAVLQSRCSRASRTTKDQ